MQRLGNSLCDDVAWLLAAQRDDGGWGASGAIYPTARAIETLVEIRSVGVSVPLSSLQRASNHLLSALEGLETPDEAQERAARARIFAALVLVPESARSEPYYHQMPRLAESLADDLESTDIDAPTLTYALIGLQRFEGRDVTFQHRATLWQAARRLWQRRHEEEEWSPSSFDEQGGDIALTALAFEVIYQLDREWFEASRQEVMRHMITERESDGGWLDPVRTAAAVRTLFLINPISSRTGSTGVVVVSHGDRNLERVELHDPVAAAEALVAIPVEHDGEPQDQLEVAVENGIAALVFLETEPLSD
jgi:hypothetical protein